MEAVLLFRQQPRLAVGGVVFVVLTTGKVAALVVVRLIQHLLDQERVDKEATAERQMAQAPITHLVAAAEKLEPVGMG